MIRMPPSLTKANGSTHSRNDCSSRKAAGQAALEFRGQEAFLGDCSVMPRCATFLCVLCARCFYCSRTRFVFDRMASQLQGRLRASSRGRGLRLSATADGVTFVGGGAPRPSAWGSASATHGSSKKLDWPSYLPYQASLRTANRALRAPRWVSGGVRGGRQGELWVSRSFVSV